MNTSCQINAWTAAYLSHSDPRERVKRSDTCGSPKAHQSGAGTNPDHAQHGYSTVQENGMDLKKKKKKVKVGPKKKIRVHQECSIIQWCCTEPAAAASQEGWINQTVK